MRTHGLFSNSVDDFVHCAVATSHNNCVVHTASLTCKTLGIAPLRCWAHRNLGILLAQFAHDIALERNMSPRTTFRIIDINTLHSCCESSEKNLWLNSMIFSFCKPFSLLCANSSQTFRIFAQNLFEMIRHCIIQNLCCHQKSKGYRANKND